MVLAGFLSLEGSVSGGGIRSGFLHKSGRIITWGDQLIQWDGAVPKVLAAHVNFGEGGCLAGDHLIVAAQPGLGPMVRIHLSRPQVREVIEPETEFSDCAWTKVLGREGLVVIHRYMQVRFYEPGGASQPSWPYHELYSIYTASTQGGLLQQDVDSDGIPDFYIGNYWMKSPRRFDLPWRIFAINLYHATPAAALARIVPFRGKDIVWAERKGRRVTWFERPPNVQDQWIPHALEFGIDEPSGLVVDGDSIIAGGRDRIVLWKDGRTEELARGFRTLNLILTKGRLWAITPEAVRPVPYPRR